MLRIGPLGVALQGWSAGAEDDVDGGRPLPAAAVFISLQLPNPGAILRLQIKFFARRGLEDLIPGIDIAHCIAPIFYRRIRLCFELLTQRSFGLEFPPSLCERHEETLFSGQIG